MTSCRWSWEAGTGSWAASPVWSQATRGEASPPCVAAVGHAGDTLLLNTAYVPTGPTEAAGDNNVSVWQTTVLAARDPNEISVSPTGGTDRGQRLTYTLQCENTGLGTAYGVYATTTLDRNLDAATLLVTEPARRCAMTRSAAPWSGRWARAGAARARAPPSP